MKHLSPRTVLFWLSGLALMLGTIAVIVPFSPTMPAAGLDPSWMAAMNQAVARGLIFGRDVVFTFGPYASIYTLQYHPGTDGLMVGGSLLLALSFAAGVLALAWPRQWLLALLTPLVLASLLLRDAFLFSLPLLYLLLAAKFVLPPSHPEHRAPRRCEISALLLLAVPLGLLPLVKGTSAALSMAIIGLVFLLLLRRHRKLALASVILWATSLLLAWLIAGQPLPDLPGFFISQGAVISGYSEAMSRTGKSWQLGIYVLAALILLGSIIVRYVRRGALAGRALLLGVALLLFVSFKAGFVRHDAHAVIASGTLLLTAWILALGRPGIVGTGALLVSLPGWYAIEASSAPMTPRALQARLGERFDLAYDGAMLRLRQPEALAQHYSDSLRAIRSRHPLPSLPGSVDVYSHGQAMIFAHGFEWSPRPVPQSYSAYTAKLLRLNADHLLKGTAPKHIVFTVEEIDNRLPALEDGLSWPPLLTRYDVVGLQGKYGILRRRETPLAASATLGKPLFEGRVRLGEDLLIPETDAPLWAEVDLRPTLRGRLGSILFKSPAVKILLAFEDGRQKTFRLIPAMARTGFLLSPVVEDTAEFLTLGLLAREPLLANKSPQALKLTVKEDGEHAWQQELWLRIRPLVVPYNESAASALLQRPLEDLPAPANAFAVRQGGKCGIDRINRHSPVPEEVSSSGLLAVHGWAAVAPRQSIASEAIFLRLRAADRTLFVPLQRTGRVDVKRYFGHPRMPDVGFFAAIDLSGNPGTYDVQLLQQWGNQLLECAVKKRLVVTS